MENKLTFGILITATLSLILTGCSKSEPAQLEDKQVDVQETVIDSAEAYASDGDNSGTEAVASATTVEKGSDTDVAKADAFDTDATDTDASNTDVVEASDTARTDDANKSDNDELSAYADFLSDYMSHPVVSTLMADDFGGEEDDSPADAESVYFTLIYVNDDDTIELALTNGACPWNPVHLFTYENGEVRQEGEYSMYGMMYYSPKSGHILPMYYPPAGEAEIDVFNSDETISCNMDEEFGSYLPVADYNSICLAKVSDFEQELVQLKKTAPIGVTPLGAPIIDDSYLTEGEVTFEGKHAEQIPGIWYLQTDDDIEITWIEFDTNGTFTTHNIYNETNVGYIQYEEESPLLEDGGIYYLYNSDGTRYDSFEIGPVEDYGYIMNFFGRVYFKHPETWKDSLSPEEMQKFAVDRSYRFLDGAVVNKDTVYEQYEKLVATLMPQNWDGFQLIDFDNDGIPELIATNANENRPDPGMQPYLVVGHNDEELVRNPILEDGVASAGGYRGTLYYLPDTGKFLHATISAPLGIPADYVYQLVEGAVVEIESGYFEVDQDSYSDDSDWDPMEHGTWYWGGQEVTEEKYTEYFKAATENTKGIALSEIDYVDKDTILKLLEH